jgi:nucleotide-binding universal stress UspA family protein
MDLVLVGDDGSDDAAVAIGWASRFATERDAELSAVHVPIEGEPVAPPTRVERQIVRSGHPAAGILQAAHDLHASVIVVGRRGRGGFAALPMGGTAYQIAAVSPIPVVVVPVVDRFDAGALVRKVVVGIDGLPESSDAAIWAARHCNDAHFTAVHALELAPAFAQFENEPGMDAMYERARARAAELMRDVWCRPFVDARVTFDLVVEEGGAVEVLLATITRAAADLVVVSRRDRHLRRGTLGGVSQRILSYASCAAAMAPSPS